MPFRDKKITICQGYHWPFGHHEIRPTADYSFSVDFALPLGTPVFAARRGMVCHLVDTETSFYEGEDYKLGKTCIGNGLQILHDDNTFVCYWHLSQHGFLVKENMRVSAGQELGLTGLSGWIGSIPNLHFMIYRWVPVTQNGRHVAKA